MIFEKTEDDLGEIQKPPRFKNLELAPVMVAALWTAVAVLVNRP